MRIDETIKRYIGESITPGGTKNTRFGSLKAVEYSFKADGKNSRFYVPIMMNIKKRVPILQ